MALSDVHCPAHTEGVLGSLTRNDAKLASLAADPMFEGTPLRVLREIGMYVDRLAVGRGTTLAVSGRRIAQPMLIRSGSVAVRGKCGVLRTHDAPTALGVHVRDLLGQSLAYVEASSDIDVWVVAPRCIERLCTIAPRIAGIVDLASDPELISGAHSEAKTSQPVLPAVACQCP